MHDVVNDSKNLHQFYCVGLARITRTVITVISLKYSNSSFVAGYSRANAARIWVTSRSGFIENVDSR